MINVRKIEFEFFSNSAISPNFYDFLYKCYHISVVIKDISKIPNVLTSWDVKLEVRMSFNKKIHTSALSEMFKIKLGLSETVCPVSLLSKVLNLCNSTV